MSTPEERIAELARKNALSPVEAAKLLAAVKMTPVATSTWSPIDRIGLPALLGIAVVTSALSLVIAHYGVRFPGFIDMMHADHPISLSVALIDQIVVFPLSSLVFYGIGRIVSSHVRYIDMLATVGPARLPLVLSVLPVALTGNSLLAVLALLGLALQVTFIVLSFRTATGARGKSLVFGVVGSMFAAEVLAKVISAFVP